MKHSPFFLTGAPKSGTTWLGKLLDAHPQISCRGEACMHHFGLQLVQAGKNYNELLDRRRRVVTDANDFPSMQWADMMTLMRTFMELRFLSIADPAKSALKFLGEKDPEHALHLGTLNKLFPEAKVLHIIRDGRGVFISAWHHNVRTKEENIGSLGFDGFLDLTAKEWADRVRRARAASGELGDRYFEVRYEDLVAAPATWMDRVLMFLGATAEATAVSACIEAASFEKLSQGRKTGEENKASFFRKGDPDDWRAQLTPAQVARFKDLSGGLSEELGYSA